MLGSDQMDLIISAREGATMMRWICILCALVMLLGAQAFAALEQEYQAVKAAGDLMQTEIGCTSYGATLSGPFTVGAITTYNGKKVVNVKGYTLRVTCNAYRVAPPTPLPPVTPPTVPNQPKSITLTWTAPTKRADGSALAAADIAGYLVFRLEGTGAATVATEIGKTTLLAHTVPGLTPGVYRFALKTIDVFGLVSELSSDISVPISAD